MFDSRSVSVVAEIAILEGERDYSEQALTTPTLQRSHFLRGVVNTVLVSVKVQGVRSMFLNKSQKICLYVHQKPICAQPTNTHILYFIVFVMAGIALHKSKHLASTEQ